ncbi:MAG: type II toxin-antitoxin system RelE/ParE family toxin [Clostridia bacterium]|nr:type II toxin-antitoxin system RelE/ParE family toxin [Clostridia bacterium]MDE7328269.1 type II toxin-antitoxin system RelE/ParE family toxin [Clostridia bacterium]
MDKYKSVIVKQAEEDIAETLEYISTKLFNPAAAQNLLYEIIEAVERISTFPYSMPTLKSDKIQTDIEYRRVEVKNFALIYKVVEEAKEVRIMAVFYGASDVVSRIIKRSED